MHNCQFNDALFIENAETNSHSYPEVLSTDPVEQTPYPIWDTELAWDLDAEVLDILRIEHASLKLNCFAVNQKTNQEESLGHIILDLSTAFEADAADERWVSLAGANSAGFRGLQPELKIAFSIDDGITEVTPTIDTLLTSIESHSGSEEVETEQQVKPYYKSETGVLEDLQEENEFEYDDDQDAQVPSVGDRSFYHAASEDLDLDDHDEVPGFEGDTSMQMDIPVDIGEAMIPTEVNDKGFLQLGLGRDFFIFTITIQTTRNMEQLVERYASMQGKTVDSVQQGLYLYYSFLGNNVATQFLTTTQETGTPIEEIALRLKSSMESMYQHFRDGEQLVIHLCHGSNLIGTATIPLAVILLHGTANLFHASPQYYPFHAMDADSSESPSDTAFVQVAMHVTRDLNTLSVPSTPAIRRSSQSGTIKRATRPVAIEVDTTRQVHSSNSSRSPKRHDYKFSIELNSFKSLSRSLTSVSLRYNYRPFGPKSTQPPINVSRMVQTPLPDSCRTFQLCQTPEALRNQLKTPLMIEVWCQHPDTHQNVQHGSGQIHLIDILDESPSPSTEGRVQRIQSTFVAVREDGVTPVGEVQFACSLEDMGEYFDSQQSEIMSTTPVHSMELHHSRGLSDDMSSAGPEPQYGFHPRGNSSKEQEEDRAQSQHQQQAVSHFAEGYTEQDRAEHTTSHSGHRSSHRPASVRRSQVRHLSQTHQNSHPHHHHPYGKPSSPSGKNEPATDYQTALKQQLMKQAELNRQVEYDLLRRSPISSLPHSLQQTLQAEKLAGRPGTALDSHLREESDAVVPVTVSDDLSAQQAKQKMKDLKALDYQVQKQLIALEFRERKLLRAEEALQRQQANFQKVMDRHGYSHGAFHHPNQPLTPSTPGTAGGAQPILGSAPSPQDYFLLQDRFRALQRQNQMMEAEFNQYRQDHPQHMNMTSVNQLHQTIAELEAQNSKLMHDVTFSNNYKEHYKALWTHSLQEIASMRQDLQMGMEIKMMQQFNEVDQLKLMGITRSEADHGQDRRILRGVKTELELLQHQRLQQIQQHQQPQALGQAPGAVAPTFPDEDMSWEQPLQEVPGLDFQRPPYFGDRRDEDDEDAEDQGGAYGPRGGHGGQHQQRSGQHSSQQQQQQQQQQSQQQRRQQQQYRGHQQSRSGYEQFPGSVLENEDEDDENDDISKYHQGYSQANLTSTTSTTLNGGATAGEEEVEEDEYEHDLDHQEDITLVENTMMRSMPLQYSMLGGRQAQQQKPSKGMMFQNQNNNTLKTHPHTHALDATTMVFGRQEGLSL
ncbi:hypothetical protein BGZ83_001866 [Gryganskiella cystojenkinii]|nr:hypothetical protein BGZ83_001866 [Gryganskiella cystojenkinii]